MKSDVLFYDLKSKDNIKVLDVNEKIKKQLIMRNFEFRKNFK